MASCVQTVLPACLPAFLAAPAPSPLYLPLFLELRSHNQVDLNSGSLLGLMNNFPCLRSKLKLSKHSSTCSAEWVWVGTRWELRAVLGRKRDGPQGRVVLCLKLSCLLSISAPLVATPTKGASLCPWYCILRPWYQNSLPDSSLPGGEERVSKEIPH